MINRHVVYGVAASILAANATAGTMGSIIPAKNWAWVGSFSAGPVWEESGKTQTVFLTPTIEKTYVANKKSRTIASGEFFMGIQKSLSANVLTQFGLAVASTSSAKLQGTIWDDTDPKFDNYSYQYKINHSRIAAKGKLFLEKGYWLTPWVSASACVGFNRAYNYNNTPLIFEAVMNPNFNEHTTTAFSYTLGAGVQKFINEHWQVGMGYEFADWGQSNLGRATAQSLNSGLGLNHFYSNGVLFNFTYVA